MSTVGFIIDGVRHASFIAPQWFPDAGMTMWMFLSEMNGGDAQRMADNLRAVQWAPDENQHFLRRPLDVLRDLLHGRCGLMPEHAWRLWEGTQRWAYFIDFDSMEYEIWRYGRFELSTGRASFADLNWEGFCALRAWLLAMEAGVTSTDDDAVAAGWRALGHGVKEAEESFNADELTRALEMLKVQDRQEQVIKA